MENTKAKKITSVETKSNEADSRWNVAIGDGGRNFNEIQLANGNVQADADRKDESHLQAGELKKTHSEDSSDSRKFGGRRMRWPGNEPG